jgi:BirA family biotin operon repressor/biotin-[acetyl-CoA-carboxylase] ligase
LSELPIVKLHATASTSDELKLRFRESVLPNLFTITTENQTSGRGQRGSSWLSESGKNLTFSILIYNSGFLNYGFDMTRFVSVAIVEWLEKECQITAKIKWPNDILSANKKLAGILVEHIYKGSEITHSIIGIGLNVNQEVFKTLPNATSLKLVDGKTRDLDALINSLMRWMRNVFKDFEDVENRYEKYLLGFEISLDYSISGEVVPGKIKGVTRDGLLYLEHANSIKEYDLKKVEWIYNQ